MCMQLVNSFVKAVGVAETNILFLDEPNYKIVSFDIENNLIRFFCFLIN